MIVIKKVTDSNLLYLNLVYWNVCVVSLFIGSRYLALTKIYVVMNLEWMV